MKSSFTCWYIELNRLIKIGFYTCILIVGIAANAEASLIDRGNGLLYDPDLDITWLADANYAMTSGYDDDGKMTWSAAVTWAQQLNYLGFTNWRLPTTLDPDPSCVELESIIGPYDYYCSGSEMGHLFYTELGAVPVLPTNNAIYGPDLALFSNWQHKNYWSSTETAIDAVFPSCTSDCVWDFDFKNGVQTGYPKGFRFYSVPVHPGDIGAEIDTDVDGIPDYIDTDDDNDSILDVDDNCIVTQNVDQANNDGDGQGDACDVDDDNDGVPDLQDAFPLDASETVDTDGDGVGNNTDNDDDNDGVIDLQDAFPLDASESLDSDGDGVGNNADNDDDNDGVPDTQDDFPLDASETIDTDGDGIGNNADNDDDNDGISDPQDAFPLDASETVDTDGDGVGDNADNDDDNDGVPDPQDAFPLDASETVDTDGDGVGNNADTDDDNDGTSDPQDAFPLDASETADTDGDGVGDNADAFPNNPNETSDSDNDGVGDYADKFPNNPDEWLDSDNDGYGNNQDADDDNDGIPDWVEVKYTLNTVENDALQDKDADGYSNLLEYLGGSNIENFYSVPILRVTPNPDNPAQSFDTDEDGISNDQDMDDDNDGYEDTLDHFPLDVNEWLDSDGDTIGDNADLFPTDPDEWLDSDLDGIGNNRDSDDDNDGTPDIDDAYPYDASRSNFDSDSGGALSIWLLVILLPFSYWRNRNLAVKSHKVRTK